LHGDVPTRSDKQMDVPLHVKTLDVATGAPGRHHGEVLRRRADGSHDNADQCQGGNRRS
jgi:hypothetical protein